MAGSNGGAAPILISGGGIGGLVTAYALARQGHKQRSRNHQPRIDGRLTDDQGGSNGTGAGEGFNYVCQNKHMFLSRAGRWFTGRFRSRNASQFTIVHKAVCGPHQAEGCSG